MEKPLSIVLVGADLEENLGVGMIAAAAERRGHRVRVVPFNGSADAPRVVASITERAPDVVGLSVQFQHRAHEFLALAAALRSRGYRGHITAGGQFPTLAWRETLFPRHGVDTVVLHDGEAGFVELLAALGDGRPVADVPGLALRGADGVATRTRPRALEDDLDARPFPKRYREHSRHMGVPFIPLMASRGCWGSCTYCSITSFYRDAREYGGGRTVRLRSPENVALEMATLWHAAGGEGVFCFHDDNFLLPKPEATRARMRALRAALDGLEVGRVGMIGKCRPETLTRDLARELRELGVVRLYVGVENASEAGAAHLNRSTQRAHIRDALAAAREAGIFVCYNLLLFEPDATLADVRENVAFIREHAEHPINFCRAEPYYGTPLHATLRERATLGGSYMGFDYRLDDPATEVLFRVCSAAFRQRNFDPEGVHNRYMGLGYSLKLLEFFYEGSPERKRVLGARARDLTRAIARDTAAYLEEAIDLVERCGTGEREVLERETARLGLRIAATDKVWHAQLDELYADMAAFARDARRPRAALAAPPRLFQLARAATLGLSLATWASSTPGCASTVDPVPPDSGRADASDVLVSDPLPMDSGRDVVMQPDNWVVDALPMDAGRDAPVEPDSIVVDPPPPDSGRAPTDALLFGITPGGDSTETVPARDAPANTVAAASSSGAPARRRLDMIDRWTDTAPRRAQRASELPLFDPPDVALRCERDGATGAVRVVLVGGPEAVGLRWQSDGEVQGEGREVRWLPASREDQLRVAVRSRGGVAVLAVRAQEVAPAARS